MEAELSQAMFFDADVSDIVLPLEQDKHLLGRSENAFPRLRTLLGSNPGAWQQKARYREDNGLLILNGAPSGIRTRDIHLERVASLAARRWGQRERV